MLTTSSFAAPSALPAESAHSPSLADAFRVGAAPSDDARMQLAEPYGMHGHDQTLSVLAASLQSPPFPGNYSLTVSPEFAPDPLSEIFQEQTILSQDSMRVLPDPTPSQPPILVPALDNVFFQAPELDVLLILVIAAILYRFGARALRFHR
jgi:hypothetical protein